MYIVYTIYCIPIYECAQEQEKESQEVFRILALFNSILFKRVFCSEKIAQTAGNMSPWLLWTSNALNYYKEKLNERYEKKYMKQPTEISIYNILYEYFYKRGKFLYYIIFDIIKHMRGCHCEKVKHENN